MPGSGPARFRSRRINQPPSAFILGALEDVHDIRYFAPVDAADRLSSAAFTAWIDLKDVVADPTTGLVTVPVHLIASDQRVTILDYTPQQVTIHLDPIVSRSVPVTVSHGPVPEGLEVGEPVLSQATVTASGPESVVSQIVSAEARVRIQSSGIDVDQLVDLVAVDGRDEVLSPVDLTPSSIRVSIQVGNPVTTKSVPVVAIVSGTPGDGFEIVSTTLDPPVATISGDAVTLATLTSVATLAVSVEGATASLTQKVGLALPDGLTVVGSPTVSVTVGLRASAATRNFSAGLIVVGAEPDRTYAIGVDSVVITLGGGQQALDAVDAGAFAASVNVAGLPDGQQQVGVRVAVPAGLRLISISPAQVTVFVGTKATPPPTPAPTLPPTLPRRAPTPIASVEPSPSP